MIFQASDLKGKQFLNLLDGDNNIIEPSYIKGGSWLLMFKLSAADIAGKAWLDTALHSFMQTQRFSPFVYLATPVARIG